MLRKLSRRFTAVGVAALFCVDLLTVLLINGLNAYYTVAQADSVVQLLIENKGTLPERAKPDRPQSGEGGGGKKPEVGFRSDEANYFNRYFTVMISDDGKVDRIDTGNISSVTSEEAEEYALDVFEQGEDGGFYDGYNFRYAVKYAPDGGGMAVFYDFGEKANTILTIMEISGVIAVLLLVIFSFIIRLFAKRAVRPTIESIENQRRFITDAGHELKTPLAIIRADAEVIEMTGGESEWTRSIVNQTDRLNELMSQMLVLTKSQETVKTDFKQFDLSQAFSETADEFTALFSANGKTLDVRISPGITVCGDRQMLCTLLSVLLQNAAKYSSDGEAVGVELNTAGSKAVLTVTNLCDEPPKVDTKLLFERFYRADSSRTRETGGSGIGLSIAKAIADSHKAKIGCSVDGKRITFTVKIPI
jgi:signal transduction histidine kinase